MAGKLQTKRKPDISDNTALALLRANIDDPKGKNPQAIDGFDWSLLGPDTSIQPPPGAITADDVAQKLGISVGGAFQILKRRVESGILERGMFRVRGQNRPKPYFWEKKNAR